MRVQLWFVGVAGYTCGLVSRIVFWIKAPQGQSSAGAYLSIQRQLLWYGLGLALLFVAALRPSYRGEGPTKKDAIGCLSWLVAAFFAIWSVVS
jgi:hypothetical protein